MKKILGISLVAVLAVTPLMASADDVTLKTFTASNNIATTSYVKGAYNDLGETINTKQDKITDKNKLSADLVEGVATSATVSALTTRVGTAESDIDALEAGKVNTSAISSTLSATSTNDQVAGAKAAKDYADSLASNYDAAGSAATAKSEAISAAASDATTKANAAQAAAEETAAADATAKANKALQDANAYTDTQLGSYSTTTQMTAAITDAIDDLNLGNTYDIKGAAATAEQNAKAYTDTKLEDYTTTTGMNSAIATAKSEAATDATTKADAAEANAKSYADGLDTAMKTRVGALETASATHATKTGVVNTIKGATYNTTLTASTVEGTVSVPQSGTVKVLDDWSDETSEGTADVSFVNDNVALAGGRVASSTFSTTATAATYPANQ